MGFHAGKLISKIVVDDLSGIIGVDPRLGLSHESPGNARRQETRQRARHESLEWKIILNDYGLTEF